jgi:glyoxylase-like metal-dependent hydrolase (beta-lactamase superfamily II)
LLPEHIRTLFVSPHLPHAGYVTKLSRTLNPMNNKFASQADLEDKIVSFDKLSDHAYAYTAQGDPNTGIIVGDDGVMVVDTQATPVMAQDVIRRISEVTDKPVKYVALSHYHAVRVLGASAYRPEQIIASQDTFDLIVERGAEDMKSEIERFPRLFRSVDSVPGLTRPTLVFQKQLTVWLGKLEVRLMQVGRGHTKGDTVVWLPRDKVLFSGDLVEFDATPYAGDAYFADWPAALDAIEALKPHALVPGRGAALKTPTEVAKGLDGTRSFVSELYRSVQEGAKQGKALREIYRETYARMKPKYGHWAIFDHCLPFDVSRAYVDSTIDLSGIYGICCADFYYGFPRLSTYGVFDAKQTVTSQELRLTSKIAGPIDWVAGAFFEHQNAPWGEVDSMPGYEAWLFTPGTGPYAGGTPAQSAAQVLGVGPRPLVTPPDTVFTDNRHISFLDRAVFGEITYHVTREWQVTAGAREFWERYASTEYQTLPECFVVSGTFCGAPPDGVSGSSQATDIRHNVFKLNSGYHLGQEANLYATWSQGYRHGGTNAVPLMGYFAESPSLVTYKGDKVNNFEFGIKGDVGPAWRYSTALFWIDWDQPQFDTFGPHDGAVYSGKTPARMHKETRGGEPGARLSDSSLCLSATNPGLGRVNCGCRFRSLVPLRSSG